MSNPTFSVGNSSLRANELGAAAQRAEISGHDRWVQARVLATGDMTVAVHQLVDATTGASIRVGAETAVLETAMKGDGVDSAGDALTANVGLSNDDGTPLAVDTSLSGGAVTQANTNTGRTFHNGNVFGAPSLLVTEIAAAAATAGTLRVMVHLLDMNPNPAA